MHPPFKVAFGKFGKARKSLITVLDTDSTFRMKLSVGLKHSLATGNWYVGDLSTVSRLNSDRYRTDIACHTRKQVQTGIGSSAALLGFTEPVGRS